MVSERKAEAKDPMASLQAMQTVHAMAASLADVNVQRHGCRTLRDVAAASDMACKQAVVDLSLIHI